MGIFSTSRSVLVLPTGYGELQSFYEDWFSSLFSKMTTLVAMRKLGEIFHKLKITLPLYMADKGL